MRRGHKFLSLIIALTIFSSCFLFSSCSREPISRTMFMLDTIVTITIYNGDEGALDGAFSLCTEYEKMLSRTYEGGELYELNKAAAKAPVSINVSFDLAYLIERSIEFSEMSDGLFDITIGPVSSLWDFKADNPAPPDANLIAQKLKSVGYKKISIDNNIFTTSEAGVQLDLGAAAKGYIADKIKEYLIENGVKSAVIDLGGNVVCLGSKSGGQAFQVGVKKPFASASDLLAVLSIKDKSIVTSGNYERYFYHNEVLYHHILNPKTGYPTNSQLNAVTIISDESLTGEGLSTSCFALGLKDGLEFINSIDGVYAIFVLNDGTYVLSDGFDNALKAQFY